MNRRTLLALALAASVSGAIGLSPADAADRTLSLGANNNETDFIAPAFKEYARLINEYSNGELEVEIFWSSQLGGAREMAQSVAVGALDMQLDVIELLVAFEPRIGALSLPLVFRDREHFANFLGSDVFGEFLDTLEAKGIMFPGREGLGDPETATQWVRPYDRGIVSKRPVFSPDDLEGFKLRMYESEIPIKSWEALGANVQVVPWPDVYTSLATGVVDGLTGTITDNFEMKHFENAPYWTNVHEYFQVMHPWMSKITWESLTPSQQEAINKATVDVGAEFAELMQTALEESSRRAKEDFGVSIIEPPIGPWIDKMEPALADFESRGLVEEGLIGRMKAVQ